MTRWWRDAVTYEVHPRAFRDADGDGVGDLAGLTARLDHLAWLGADAVWVTPFYPSPLADAGYDVSDPTGVDPRLGTEADFDALVGTAHRLGLKLVLDLVPNHTSERHPWFRAALADRPDGPDRRRYLFRDGRDGGRRPPNDWESAFGGPAWTRVPDGQWYLHLHAPQQPDLDWRHPAVRAGFEEVLRHWLDRGVDGFRIDVAHTLFKAPGLPDAGPGQRRDPARTHLLPYHDQEELHPLFRSWRALLDRHPAPSGAVPPDERLLVAEAAVFDPDRLARYVRPGEMDQCFTFGFLECAWDGRAMREVVDGSVAAMASVGAPVTWVLSSHDAVRPVTRYGGGAAGLRRARAAALLMLALPGAAYVYQGEELGLPQVELPPHRLRDPVWERSGRTVRGRDGCRVPLPWSGAAPPYGFGTADPDACWFPQPADWGGLTVAAQRADPGSTLRLYREALRLRRGLPPARVPFATRGPADGGWLAFPFRGPDVCCVVNFGPEPLSLAAFGDEVLLSSAPTTAGAGAGAGGTLPPDTAAWVAGGDRVARS